MGYSPELNPDEFTVSCWVKVQGGVGTRRSVVNSRYDITGPVPPPDHRGYDLYINTSNQWCFSTGMIPGIPILNELISSQQPVVGQWMHVVAVLERGTVNAMTLYVDGNPAGSLPVAMFTPNSQSTLRIGGGSIDFQPPIYFLDGHLDDVRVYNRALSAVEAAALHANTIELDVQVDPVEGGSVVLDRAGGIYQPNEEVSLTAVAASGYMFDFWGGDLSGTDNPATITMDSNKRISAHFVRAYVLAVQTYLPGAGSVEADPTAGEYPAGAEVALTAVAGQGWVFDHWSGGASGSANPTSIVMDSDKSITANFVIAGNTIIVDDDGPGHFSSIQDAVDFAVNGQVIEVNRGRYVEQIDLLGKAITLTSTDWNDLNTVMNTIIDGGGTGRCIIIARGESSATMVRGFLITGGVVSASQGGSVYGGGIFCSSSPVIENCCIMGNYALSTVDNNYNQASAYAGGMYISGGSPTLRNCTFSGNSAWASSVETRTAAYGGGMHISGGSPTVINCTFGGNSARASSGLGDVEAYGGGINGFGSNATFSGCTIRDNSVFSDGAVSIAAGGGLYSSIGVVTLEETLICGNHEWLEGNVTFNQIEGGYTDGGDNIITVICPGVGALLKGDVDGDGDVDLTDFAIMAANWPAGT